MTRETRRHESRSHRRQTVVRRPEVPRSGERGYVCADMFGIPRLIDV